MRESGTIWVSGVSRLGVCELQQAGCDCVLLSPGRLAAGQRTSRDDICTDVQLRYAPLCKTELNLLKRRDKSEQSSGARRRRLNVGSQRQGE